MAKWPRWYSGRHALKASDTGNVPIQNDMGQRPDARTGLPRELVEMAGREYEKQGYGQTFERLCERGGLGIVEIALLLGDALERERSTRRGG